MTLVAIDGFDMYNGVGANTGLSAKWIQGVGSRGLQSTNMVTGRFGGQAVNIPASVSRGSCLRPLSTNRTVGANGLAFKTNLYGTDSFGFMGITSNGYPQFGIALGGSGQLIAYRGASSWIGGGSPWDGGGTAIGSSVAGVIPLNTWVYIEMEWTLSSSSANINVYVEGASVMSLTGVNNMAFTSSGYTNADGFYIAEQVIGGGQVYFDDYYEADTNTKIGIMRIDTLRPTADSAVQWTPNSGVNNYSRVNETLVDGDTSYVSDNTIGHSDLYSIAPLGGSPTTIYGVQPVMFGEKTDANPRSVYMQVKSGGTLDLGAAQNLMSNYGRFERMLLNDPATSAPFANAAAVNGLLIGPQLAS